MKESSQSIVKITLLCIISVMGYALWYQLNKPVTLSFASNASTKLIVTDDESITETELDAPVISEFSEMIERPLFFEDRKPFVYIELEQAAPVTKRQQKKILLSQNQQYSLSAVMIKPDKQIAIIQSGKNKTLQRLTLGESIDNWVLEKIEPHSVLLKNGNETKHLELEIRTNDYKTAENSKNENKKTIQKSSVEENNNYETKTTRPKS